MESFKRYQNLRIVTTEMEIADGDYILDGITVRIKKGFLNDSLDEDGKVIPAVETHDGNHIEHWKNGVLHCEFEPAVIDVRDGKEEWWQGGKQVEPVSVGSLERVGE